MDKSRRMFPATNAAATKMFQNGAHKAVKHSVIRSTEFAKHPPPRALAGKAEAIQLVIEYDPSPPFDASHMSKASKQVQRLAKQMMDDSIPADQRRHVPKIAWRRFIDLVRTGK